MVKTGPKEKSKESINKRADEASLTNDPTLGVERRFTEDTFRRKIEKDVWVPLSRGDWQFDKMATNTLLCIWVPPQYGFTAASHQTLKPLSPPLASGLASSFAWTKRRRHI